MQRYAPDTNFFFQFKPPEDVPWSELTNANDIGLVVLAEVLGELDKHKNGGNQRQATRSRNTLQHLRPLIVTNQETIEIRKQRPRLVYRLAPDLPAERAKPTTLDTSTTDGRIVEETLAYKAAIGDITLLTYDSLPMLTARRHGLPVVPLPDTWRLPPERDTKGKLERYHLVLNSQNSLYPLTLSLQNIGSASAESFVVEVFAEGGMSLASPKAVSKFWEEHPFKLDQPPPPPSALLGDFNSLGNRIDIPESLLRSLYVPNARHTPVREFYWQFDEPDISGERLEDSYNHRSCATKKFGPSQASAEHTLTRPHEEPLLLNGNWRRPVVRQQFLNPAGRLNAPMLSGRCAVTL